MVRRTIIPEDLYKLNYVHSPCITRQGDKIAYVITETNMSCDAYKSKLYKMNLNDKLPEEIGDGNLPAWSPNGRKLAFLHDGQIWLKEDEKELKRITALSGKIREIVWSPVGGQILAAVELPTYKKDGPVYSNLHHITDLKYKKDGQGYIYNRETRLFLIDVDEKKIKEVSSTRYNIDSPVWSPDGQKIAYITSDSDPGGTWERRVVSYDLQNREEHTICYATGAQNLSWSPDGDFLSFRAAEGNYDPSISFGLWIVKLDEGELLQLTEGMDIFVGNDRTLSDTSIGTVSQGGVWSADSQRLFFIAAERGRNLLYEITLAEKKIKCLSKESEAEVINNFSYAPEKDCFIVSGANFQNPGDLWLLPSEEKVTDINNELLSEINFSIPEKFTWTNDEENVIDGWLLKPPNFKEDNKYPAILEVHGGPYRQYGKTFFYEMQILAAAGHVILFSNPRGSQGYGQEFARAIRGDWGNKDYSDLMAGIKKLKSLDFIDENRLGVTGGSYGGYMTNWLVSQTDVFKAAVTDRSVSNLYSFMGTSDIAISFGESDFGNIWQGDRRKKMRERSPLTYVENINTPLLIMHQMEDQSCPLEQAEQLYVALKRRGAPVEMLLFPEACHELSRSGIPFQRVMRLKWIVDWMQEYL